MLVSIRRGIFFLIFSGVMTASPAVVQQPQGNVPRIGILIAETRPAQQRRLDALHAGLRDRGYVEGRNIAIEIRSADGYYERLPRLAAELTRLKVDVLVAFGIKALIAARDASTAIPIVIPATSSDLVAMGLVKSLAQPGGNITGSTTFGSEIMAKRLELLKEVIPSITKVAVLENSANPSIGPALQEMANTAKALKVSIKAFDVRVPSQLDNVFAAMAKERINAIVVQDDTLFAAHAKDIVDLAAKQRLASIGDKGLAEAGALIGYGRMELELYRRGAYFVDRILKGAAPGTLPIEQATRFQLLLNTRTAHTLGIKFPESVLLRADNVIK